MNIQHCIEVHRKTEHLKKRTIPEIAETMNIPERLAHGELAEQFIKDSGLWDEYKKVLYFMADLYDADRGLKQ